MNFILGVILVVLFIGVIAGGIVDDEEKRKGIQPRKYYRGKAGMQYKAPGEHESRFMGYSILFLYAVIIIGFILGG